MLIKTNKIYAENEQLEFVQFTKRAFMSSEDVKVVKEIYNGIFK